ncbi:MAG: hypothetical protein ACFB0C_14980 [Leptolyngbyaceae cyanobacterium]
MAQTKPMLRFLLPGLTATVALALTTTLFSENKFRLFNGWELFNNWHIDFSTHGQNPESPDSEPATDAERETPSPDQPEPSPIFVHFEPVITVAPAEVNVLPEIAVNVDPSINVDNNSEVNLTKISPQIEINWPEFEVEQEWLLPQGNATQALVAALVPGSDHVLGPWGASPVSLFSSWDASQQFVSIFNGLSQSSESNQSQAQVTAAKGYHCPKPTISQVPSSVPEPNTVMGLGVMGLVLSGMVSLSKGRH